MAMFNLTTPLEAARKSVFVRVAVVSALSTLIVTVASIGFSIWQTGQVARDGVRDLAQIAAGNTAEQLGPHMRFGNAEAVQAELARHVELAGDNFVSIIAMNSSGEVIASAGDTNAANLSALAQSAINTGAQQLGQRGYLLGVPVQFDATGAPVGSIAVLWSPRAVLNTLAVQRAVGIVGLLLLLVGMTWLTARRLKTTVGVPLANVEGAIEAVARGDYDTLVPQQDSEDEVGAMARALDTLRQRLISARDAEAQTEEASAMQAAVVQRLATALAALARGDLTHNITEDLTGDYDRLREDFNSAVQHMAQVLSEMSATVTSVTQGSSAISQGSDDLAQRTEQQAATLEQTAAAIAELSSSVTATSKGARDVEKVVLEACNTAESSGAVVTSAMQAMSDIEDSSSKVSQIIGLIDEIAFQTNLLALNAGVEAARAGDAGRGFAVVASEVRSLAQRASDAASQIKGLIQESSTQVKTGVDLVGRTGEALSAISEKVASISDHISSIANEAVGQATGLGEINEAVSTLDRVTQENAAMVEESNASAHVLNGDAQRIAELIAHFQVEESSQSNGAFGGPTVRVA
jgi:methyl-accepting chemotaxis protein